MCVYDFLKENDFAPFPRDHIQSFAQQLLGSVACTCRIQLLICLFLMPSLVLHDLHIIHTDLKPENILLVRNDSRTVTIPTPGKVQSLPLPLARPTADRGCAAPWSPNKAYIRLNRHTANRFRIGYFPR